MEGEKTKINAIKIKILSLGFGQSNFLGQLYGEIKRRSWDITVDIDGFKKLSASVDNNEVDAFDNILDFKKSINLTYIQKLLLLIKVVPNKFFYIQFLHIVLNAKQKFAAIRQLAYNSIIAKAVGEHYLKTWHHDILHFHFCAPDSLIYLYFLPGGHNKKVICSFWGSDLLRYHGLVNFALQEEALKKADIITTHSPELREIILAKFGRHLKPKIRYTLFNLEVRLYDLIDKYRDNKEKINSFKSKLGIHTPYVVVVGHNANHFNNHIEILKQLNTCIAEVKREFTCVLPLTYGSIVPAYVAELEAYCKTLDIPIILVKNFLPWEEMALLRLASDIMIHMPESDALSGAATEAMYAGNILLTGAWLPYSPFRRSGLNFLELENFSDLPKTINNFINKELNLSEASIQTNMEGIKRYFFPDTTSWAWIKMYRELVSNKEITDRVDGAE